MDPAAIVQRFVDETGNGIRVNGTYDSPWFCLKDICQALGITNHRNKAKKLHENQKRLSTEWTPGGNQGITYVTESGMYRVIVSCREANVPGTAPHAFVGWITEEVLPSLRRNGRYELQQQIRQLRAEKGLRLWNVFKKLDVFSYNVRRSYFSAVCNATRKLCYKDTYNSPHVYANNVEEAKVVIRAAVFAGILARVPANQSAITNYFKPV